TDQLVRGREAINDWSGGTSIHLRPPPYGAYTRANIPAIGAAGYGTVVLWDVDTLDWTGNSVSTIVARATRGTNGSIVLGIRVIRTPIRAPNANAYAERWVETLRAECLDWLLVLGPRHLDRVLRTYVEHYNRQRPHRGLELRAPERVAPIEEADGVPTIERRDLLGGLVHEYRRAA